MNESSAETVQQDTFRKLQQIMIDNGTPLQELVGYRDESGEDVVYEYPATEENPAVSVAVGDELIDFKVGALGPFVIARSTIVEQPAQPS